MARKITLPVGAVPVVDAVNVTGEPTTDGFALDATDVVVGVATGHDAVVNVRSPPLLVPALLAPTTRKW